MCAAFLPDFVESARERRLACCQSEPECVLCPLRPENAGRSLKELAEAGLRANLGRAADPPEHREH